MEERLQKILAKAGFGSRRSCETIITAGRVRVNGKLAELGSKADPDMDQIFVDNKPIPQPEKMIYIALYKPRGVLSTVEAPDLRPTVRELVTIPGNIYPVGRLDVDSEGLILLTNDGSLTDRLTHPKYHHAKEYRILVARHPDNEQLDAFRHGVVLSDGYRTAPAEVRLEMAQGKGAWLNIILFEGRKRQIRETCAQIGLPVVRIVRIRIATLKLGNLKPGQWRHLTSTEVATLRNNPNDPTNRSARSAKRYDNQARQRRSFPDGNITRTPIIRSNIDYQPKPGKPASKNNHSSQNRPSAGRKRPIRRSG